jgi:hypothetical protein
MSQSLPRIAFFAVASQRQSERNSYWIARAIFWEMASMIVSLRTEFLPRDQFTYPERAPGNSSVYTNLLFVTRMRVKYGR